VNREELRADIVGRIPAWYSPAAHFAFPSLIGVGAVVAAALLIRDLRALELLTVPIVFLASNATEWRAHKTLLHRRTWPLYVLYDRHTPEHHRIFVTEDMAIRSAREFRLVLIPAYGILTIALAAVPLTALLWLLVSRNVGLLYMATAVGYSVSYEWLHLAYHTRAGKLPVLRWLARHHATHHDPTLMNKWNFNVTIPLWDLVQRTYYRGAPRDGAV
jgi:hypothetical protein